jgi:hypothetical protein
MALRMHPVSPAIWQRRAATRHADEAEPAIIDLLVVETESADPLRRLHAEVALIQAYVDTLEPEQAR